MLAGHACGNELGFIQAKLLHIEFEYRASTVALGPAVGLVTELNQPAPNLPYPFQLLFVPFGVGNVLSFTSFGDIGDVGAGFDRLLPDAVFAFSANIAGTCSSPWTH